MLAYVFPPFFSAGGSIRAVKFTKYLLSFGWSPIVLTIDDRIEYDTKRKQGSHSLMKDVPEQVRVIRTTAGEPSAAMLDKGRSARTGSRLAAITVGALGKLRRLGRNYLMLPDEHIVWLPFAFTTARKIIKSEQVEVVYATCPPFSVALIGGLIKRFTGKPLVLDFRDDWIGMPGHSSKPQLIRWVNRKMESWAVSQCERLIAVTESSRRAFIERYPKEPKDKFVLIPNGVDLVEFQVHSRPTDPRKNSDFTIVHAGLLSDSPIWRRSPEAIFGAVRRIHDRNPDMNGKLRLVFVGHLPASYQCMVRDMGLSEFVTEVEYLPREELIQRLRAADLLLAISTEGFSTAIPGKLYEYWAAGGPPILLLDNNSEAQRLVEKHELGYVIRPDDVAGIENLLLNLLERIPSGERSRINQASISHYDRKQLTGQLSQVLDALAPIAQPHSQAVPSNP